MDSVDHQWSLWGQTRILFITVDSVSNFIRRLTVKKEFHHHEYYY